MSVVKEGWTYKKLGEVGTLLRGKGIQKTDFVENGRPCIHYGQIHTIFGVSTERHITSIPDELFEQSVIASKGDVLLTLTSEDVEGSCKSTAWLGDYDIAVSSDAAIYKHSLNPKFVVYYLQSNSFYSEKAKYARGFKVTHIKTADIAEISIPVPPLPIQQSIVSELDKINELIALKKSQLKDLDSLAQSIFYEMFGDPITNEMGWEVKKLGDTTDIKTGSTPDRNNKMFYMGANPWVKSTEVCNCAIYDVQERISEDALKATNCTLFPINTILMAMYGQGKTRGQIAMLKLAACTNQAVAAILPSEKFEPNYLYVHLLLMYENIRSMARGGNQANLNLTLVKSIRVMVPPLSLQHQFAERVEAIERMKQEVQTAIKDLETLLASRMQYWFD